MCAQLLATRRCQGVLLVQEGIKILMQRYGLGLAALDDVFVALLDGAKTTISAGECSAQERLSPTAPFPCFLSWLQPKGSVGYP